jgi:hypothetical protein
MSDFGKPHPCRNSCGASIYFDRDSTVGHPSENKWVPLEYVNGIKTDQPHNCPNQKSDSKTTEPSEAQANQIQEPIKVEDEVVQLINVLISKLNVLIQARQK